MEGKPRRERGTGRVYQRGKKWMGRLDITSDVGLTSDGKRSYKYFSGNSEGEVKRKIREYNKQNYHISSNKVSFSEYAKNWLYVYKKFDLKRSSFDRLENTLNHQVIPYLGLIQLQQISSSDIQKMLIKLQDAGKSYSTIKKAHDCVQAIMKHALIEGDISKDPMLTVRMPNKAQFEQKEIRIFTREEAAAIVEEVGRTYQNGAPVYPYGKAYILMLNTGLREGELIGLLKEDWDKDAATIHVKRNVQSVKKREGADAAGGYELVTNSTKTYSGDRIIHLNQAATKAI